MNVALKEWSAVIEACAQDRQIFLLRKGGIVEAARHGFELRYRSFLLFPTFEHQHLSSIRPEFHDLARPQPQGVIRIGYLAKVDSVAPAPDRREKWDGLEPFHIWQPSLLDMRYQYRPDLPLHVILVRLYRLEKQFEVPDRPSYAGCKSWVHLTEELPAEQVTPVMDDRAFTLRKAGLLAALGVEPLQ